MNPKSETSKIGTKWVKQRGVPGLALSDQLLLCFPQHYQPVSVLLGRRENSLFFHLPRLTPSRGHFYLAQLGHSHVAVSRCHDSPALCGAVGYTC